MNDGIDYDKMCDEIVEQMRIDSQTTILITLPPPISVTFPISDQPAPAVADAGIGGHEFMD